MTENEDFVSFEQALRNLKMRSEELKKLVSEGDIRAFRDGTSMKFRRDDIDALVTKSSAEEELVFADALEDDTGMVTEELSDEDTLLVEDDLEEVEDDEPVVATRSRRERMVEKVGTTSEPGWVTVVAGVAFIACLWGALLCLDISTDAVAGDTLASMAFGPEGK